MIDIFLKTLPFFAILALGYGSARTRFFSAEATDHLTKFVFYFALPAMIFRFASSLPVDRLLHWPSVLAYLAATACVYLIATIAARLRGTPRIEAAFEGQSAAIGNVGFLGIPMLALILGEAAIGPIMLVLATDLVVFSSLIVVLVSIYRDGTLSLRTFKTVALGLVKNPMVMAIALGLFWSFNALPVAAPVTSFLDTLGAASTPCALFAIGASLAAITAERPGVAIWLSGLKLGLHPALVAFATLVLFDVPGFTAAVMIAAAAMPTAGNVYILAKHYGVAPLRVSSTIFISTVLSVLTLTLVIALVSA